MDGEKEGGLGVEGGWRGVVENRVWRWGKWEIIIHLSLHHQHQNDSCIKMGSNKSHFNVSVTVRNKVTRQCPQAITFLNRKGSQSGTEMRLFCLPA